MATVTGLTATKIHQLVDGCVAAEATVVTTTLAGLDSGDGAFGSFDLGHAFRLDKIESTKPCRFRVYADPTYRSADGDRPRDEDPQGDHGLVAEIILTSELLSLLLLPAPHGTSADGLAYFSVVNDGDDGDVTLTLTAQTLEN
jgi:hypothetical protein